MNSLGKIVILADPKDKAWWDSAQIVVRILTDAIKKIAPPCPPSVEIVNPSGFQTSPGLAVCAIAHASCETTLGLIRSPVATECLWIIVSGGEINIPDELVKGCKAWIGFGCINGRESHFDAWIRLWFELGANENNFLLTRNRLQRGIQDHTYYCEEALSALVPIIMLFHSYTVLKSAQNQQSPAGGVSDGEPEKWLKDSLRGAVSSGGLETIQASMHSICNPSSGIWTYVMVPADFRWLNGFLGNPGPDSSSGNENLHQLLEQVLAENTDSKQIFELVQRILEQAEKARRALVWLKQADDYLRETSHFFHSTVNNTHSLVTAHLELIKYRPNIRARLNQSLSEILNRIPWEEYMKYLDQLPNAFYFTQLADWESKIEAARNQITTIHACFPDLLSDSETQSAAGFETYCKLMATMNALRNDADAPLRAYLK